MPRLDSTLRVLATRFGYLSLKIFQVRLAAELRASRNFLSNWEHHKKNIKLIFFLWMPRLDSNQG